MSSGVLTDFEVYKGLSYPEEIFAKWVGNQMELVGQYEAYAHMSTLPKEWIVKNLPRGMELRTESDSATVLFLAGFQNNVGPMLFGRRWHPKFGKRYSEIMMIVKDVYVSDYQKECMYVMKLYLERGQLAIDLGQRYYGFEKYPAMFNWSSTNLELEKNGEKFFWMNDSAKQGDEIDEQAVAKVQDFLSKKLVSYRHNQIRCYDFIFDYERAKLRAADCDVKFNSKFMNGFGSFDSREVSGKNTSFHIWVPWKISRPNLK